MELTGKSSFSAYGFLFKKLESIEKFLKSELNYANAESIPEKEEKMSIAEAAAYLGCTTRTIDNYFNRGILVRHHEGKKVYLIKSQIDAGFMAKLKEGKNG